MTTGVFNGQQIEALLNQAALSLEVPSVYIKPLYKDFLQKSFEDHIYWYASDSTFIAVGLRHMDDILFY